MKKNKNLSSPLLGGNGGQKNQNNNFRWPTGGSRLGRAKVPLKPIPAPPARGGCGQSPQYAQAALIFP